MVEIYLAIVIISVTKHMINMIAKGPDNIIIGPIKFALISMFVPIAYPLSMFWLYQ